jgi:DNA-binding NarL/FixJ family response regulator
VKILVVDDHKLFLEGLRLVLRQLEDGTEVIEASSATDALAAIGADADLDLILLDLNMPGLDGLALLQSLGERQLWIPTVMISATDDLRSVRQALDLGALGFIPKTAHSQELLDALRSVLDGNVYVPQGLERKLRRLKGANGAGNNGEDDLPDRYGITRRQHQVLQLIARGYSNRQIADTLYLSENTVKSHVMALFSALNVSNRTECAKAALGKGLLPEG